MNPKKIIALWFSCWEEGLIHQLPIADNFIHQSPFGEVEGKEKYIDWVNANKDKFLGYRFEIHDEIYAHQKACIHYTARQGSFQLEVSEWHYMANNKISKIIAHYHIGDIRADRKIDLP